MYNLTGGEEIYKTAAQTLRDQIDRSFRTPDGGFYHRFPGYIDQVCVSMHAREREEGERGRGRETAHQIIQIKHL
jgi:hypothetical protein